MAEQKKEWVSALADGELPGDELKRALDAMRQDPELLTSWSRYHLIRDALHSNLEDHVMPDLSLRVAEALEREPVILAQQRAPRPWLRHAAGLAVAASVTGVAILGISNMNEESGPVSVAANTPQEYVRLEPPIATVAANPNPQVSNGEQLAPYLVNHNEYAVSSGMHGMLPYVRIVGHKVGQ
jgi:sigma-E factor negative regulatory protein RseA